MRDKGGDIREEVFAGPTGLDWIATHHRARRRARDGVLTGDCGRAERRIAVREFFEKNSARYAKAGRVSFRHVYFKTEKRGAGTEAAAAEALAALAKGANDETMGDPFLHGFEFVEREQDDVIAAFGREFAEKLAAQPTGEWSGPVESSYGLHLVRVEARMEPRAVKFDEVRETVLRDFHDERRRIANSEVFDKLRERYQVTVVRRRWRSAAPVIKTAQR